MCPTSSIQSNSSCFCFFVFFLKLIIINEEIWTLNIFIGNTKMGQWNYKPLNPFTCIFEILMNELSWKYESQSANHILFYLQVMILGVIEWPILYIIKIKSKTNDLSLFKFPFMCTFEILMNELREKWKRAKYIHIKGFG